MQLKTTFGTIGRSPEQERDYQQRDHIAALTAERDQLAADLATNAALLARQTDLAREAETRLAEAERLGDELAATAEQQQEMCYKTGWRLLGDRLNAALTAWRNRGRS